MLNLESAAFGGGRIIASQGTTTTYTPNYFLTDHLGSTRVVVDADGTTQQRNDYYALGERWAYTGSQISDNRYLFSGKEDQSSLGLAYSDFGARMLDKKTGRWSSIDPLAKKYYPWSPYNYALNNPIKFIDPDGAKVVLVTTSSQEFRDKYAVARQYMRDMGSEGIMRALESRPETIYIAESQDNKDRYRSGQKTIYWDPDYGLETTTGNFLSPTTALIHEADHALRHITNPDQFAKESKEGSDPQFGKIEERRVIMGSETKAARAHGEIGPGEVTRMNHSGNMRKMTGSTSNLPADAPVVTGKGNQKLFDIQTTDEDKTKNNWLYDMPEYFK